MKILIVSKTTNYELYGSTINQRVKDGLIEQDYLDRTIAAHKDHHKTLNLLRNKLNQYKLPFYEIGRGLFWSQSEKPKCILTVGGDGTVLATSHYISDTTIPLIGIRSSHHSIGRLCAFGPQDMEDLLNQLSQDKLSFSQVERLFAQIRFTQSQGMISTPPILNDFLFSNQYPAATTRYKLEINGKKEDHKSSGIWIAAPCGSTAAIAAAGGAFQETSAQSFQYFVREPYTPPHSKKANQLTKGFFEPEKQSNPFHLLLNTRALNKQSY